MELTISILFSCIVFYLFFKHECIDDNETDFCNIINGNAEGNTKDISDDILRSGLPIDHQEEIHPDEEEAVFYEIHNYTQEPEIKSNNIIDWGDVTYQ